MDFILELECLIGINAIIIDKLIQLGDDYKTYADIDSATLNFEYLPQTNYKEDLRKYVKWFVEFYK